MGRSYKWRWHRKVVKGNEEALNDNEEVFWRWKVLNANGETLKGDIKAVKNKIKK